MNYLFTFLALLFSSHFATAENHTIRKAVTDVPKKGKRYQKGTPTLTKSSKRYQKGVVQEGKASERESDLLLNFLMKYAAQYNRYIHSKNRKEKVNLVHQALSQLNQDETFEIKQSLAKVTRSEFDHPEDGSKSKQAQEVLAKLNRILLEKGLRSSIDRDRPHKLHLELASGQKNEELQYFQVTVRITQGKPTLRVISSVPLPPFPAARLGKPPVGGGPAHAPIADEDMQPARTIIDIVSPELYRVKTSYRTWDLLPYLAKQAVGSNRPPLPESWDRIVPAGAIHEGMSFVEYKDINPRDPTKVR